MISQYIEVLILAFIQGFSEFIPVSSSAHLLIISKIYNFNIGSLHLDISFHLGSLLAIIFYFKSDLLSITKNKNIFSLIILGSLPLIVVGYLFLTIGFIDYFRNLKIIAWTTLIFGLLLFFADRSQIKKKLDTNLNYKSILIVGMFQLLAIIPGVSRSGIVITIGRFLKFNRVDSTKISLYLSIPAIAGASFLSLNEIASKNTEFNILILLSIIFSFIFSFLTIKYFLIYVKNFSLNIFVVYRILLSLILFYFIYA